jgi:rhodanese-like protein
MRIVLTAAVALAMTAALSEAQYKTAPPAPQTATSPIQITPTDPLQMTQQPGGDAELAKARRITRDQAMRLVKQKKAVYVDVRSKETFDESHLPGAISLPLSQLQERFKELPLKKLLITYCA